MQLGPAKVRFTDRADGDMGHGGAYVEHVSPEVAARRGTVVDLPWTWLRQVHGADVVEVGAPAHHAGARADAAITSTPGAALAVFGADCAPVLLASEGVVGAAHVGWRGLVAGVLERTVAAMRAAGAGPIRAVVGPCIRPECYEFGTADLDGIAARLGPGVRGVTDRGRPALDLPAGIDLALAGVGVTDVADIGRCTACEPDHYYSYRGRGELGRQAGLIWIEP